MFYAKDIQTMFEFFQYTVGWVWYSVIFQQAVGLRHMSYRKSEASLSSLEKLELKITGRN